MKMAPKQRNGSVLLIIAIAFGIIAMMNMEMCRGQTICNVRLQDLMACRPAVTPPNPTQPTPGCCTAVSHADLHCLCSYKSSSLLPALGIDPSLAIQLPEKCRLPHPAPC